MSEKRGFYGDIGGAAVILALCLGLSTCMLAESYVKKQNAEIEVMKKGAEK